MAARLRLHRSPGGAVDQANAKKALDFSRNSTQEVANTGQPDTELGLPIGRERWDWPPYPDDTRGLAVNNHDPGKRLQDFANSHLSEGPNPGRIPHFWNDRRLGKVGREITGNPIGDNFLTLGVSGTPDVGAGDAKFIMHTQIPRGSVVARAYARTVDDAAPIPAVYVTDPTRR